MDYTYFVVMFLFMTNLILSSNFNLCIILQTTFPHDTISFYVEGRLE